MKELELKEILGQKRADCLKFIRDNGTFVSGTSSSSLNSGKYCEAIWDSVLCWPRTPPSTLQMLQCPEYIPGFNPQNLATRLCTSDGTWFWHDEHNSSWTNYTSCKTPPSPAPEIIRNALPIIKRMSQIGYAVSFVALTIALTILISIKKLRCPRNTLHMHLFVSFMLRAFMTVLKTMLFVEGIGLANSVITAENIGVVFNNQHPEPVALETWGQLYRIFRMEVAATNWECKLVISLWQYALVANYFWILMEGLYLHNLIFLAPFSDSSAITLYVILGWGCPMIVVIPWVLSRIYWDDTFCWTTNDNSNTPFKLFYIVQIPIVVSIGLNFILFVNIIRVLLIKLQSAVSIETRKYRYRKWAKSTLVLVPLFGVHYMALIGLSYYVGEDPVIEVIWLFGDQLFASFQGFFVSLLYCLLNGEVRSELKKLWGSWRWARNDRDIPLYRISSKFRSTGVDNSPPNELTEEQHVNDISCDDRRRRNMSSSRVGRRES